MRQNDDQNISPQNKKLINKLQQDCNSQNIEFSEIWKSLDLKIEENFQKRKTASFRFFQWIKFPATGLAAGLAVWFLLVTPISFFINSRMVSQGYSARVEHIDGTVYFQNQPGRNWHVLKPFQLIQRKAVISTLSNSDCLLSIAGKGFFKINPSTRADFPSFKTAKDHSSILVALSYGKILIKAEKLSAKDSLQVMTKHTTVSVKGTKFLVQSDTNNNMSVSVTEGKVWLNLNPLQNHTNELKQDDTNSTVVVVPGETVTLAAKQAETLEQNNPASPSGHVSLMERIQKNPILSDHLSQLEAFKPVYLYQGISIAPRLVWNHPLVPLETPGQLSIQHGMIFIADKNLLLIYTSSGDLIRTVEVAGKDTTLTKPVQDDSLLYLGSDKGTLWAYNTSGNLIWKKENAGRLENGNCPIYNNGKIIMMTADKGIQVFSTSGDLISSFEIDNEAVFAAPFVFGNGQFIVYGTVSGKIRCCDLSKRELLWEKYLPSGMPVYPILGNERAAYVLIRGTGQLLSINPMTGKEFWNITLDNMEKSDLNPIYQKGKLILAANLTGNDSVVTVVDSLNGNIIYSAGISGPILQPVMNENAVIIASKSGQISKMSKNENEFHPYFDAKMILSDIALDEKSIYTIYQNGWIKFSE